MIVRVLAHVHGHLGWLSALALAHPALMLRRPQRRVLTVAMAATLVVTATGALGAILYPTYRTSVKPALFARALPFGEIFERKEHLGVLALVLAWAGLAFCWLAARRAEDRFDIARAGFVAYTGAAAAALASAVAGLAVAVHASF